MTKRSEKESPVLSLEDRLNIKEPFEYFPEGINIEKLGRIQHESAWVDVENKAKRLVADGKVYISEKKLHDFELPEGPIYIEGTVVGDNSVYKSQIWTANSDPRSLFIRSWACECTWNRYVWNRTRQWKKYEGRLCSHVLALYWHSKKEKLDEDSQEAIQRSKTPEDQQQLFEAPEMPGRLPEALKDRSRGEPGEFGYDAEVPVNPSTNMTLWSPEEEALQFNIEKQDEEGEHHREPWLPYEQAQRPLDLDTRYQEPKKPHKQPTEIPGFGDAKVYRGPGGKFVKNVERLEDLRKRVNSSFTILTVKGDKEINPINDIIKYIKHTLMEGGDVSAYTTKEFWGERRGGLHAHPDAAPIDRMEDGNFIFMDEDLGWHPEFFDMGHEEEERGTYGAIPAQSEVKVISVDPRDRLALIHYEIGNQYPNHEHIDVWVALKDIYLI